MKIYHFAYLHRLWRGQWRYYTSLACRPEEVEGYLAELREQMDDAFAWEDQ